MLSSVLALALTGAQALRPTVACGTAAAATSLTSTKPALSASASSRVSPGSPTMKMFGADNNQVTPDDSTAWNGGSEQKITWKFEGAVPEVDITLQHPQFGIPGGLFFKGLAYDVKNTGSHVVTVPTGLVPGKYFLKVASRSDNRVYAVSPTFTIDKSATPPEISDVALGGLPFR